MNLLRSYVFIFFWTFFVLMLHADERIYCIMITGKDKFHYPLALCSIQSFLEQIYPNKELIIINDGEYNFDHLHHELIHEIHLDKKLTLGELRNCGLDAIPENAIWTQWDDDDWRHPNAIQEQYEFLRAQDLDACCMTSQIQYCSRINHSRRKIRCFEGTVMARNDLDIRYPNVNREEDTHYLNSYRQKHKFGKWKNPSYYYLRFIHGKNTWDESHFEINDQYKDIWFLNKKEKSYLQSILPLYDFEL